MSLTAARGPFGTDPAGWSIPPLPSGGVVYIEPHPRRIRADLGGRTVIDTEAALLVHRAGSSLAYAFPAAVAEGLASTPVLEAPGYVHVPWTAVDEWFEEGRQLVHYPPNPYHRVDCRPVARRLRVAVGDPASPIVLVDTDDTVILFETSLDPRLYVARSHVRMDQLIPSDTVTYCNYKGWCSYWSAVIGDAVIPDVAWSYDDPLPESLPIAGHLSFDAARVDVTAELPAPAA